MLNRTRVDQYANANQIDAYVAERDIILTYVLKILKDEKLLDELAFKGGTCLKKIYYGNTTRFSEDLDFTYIKSWNKRFPEKIKNTFNNKEYYDISFKINDEYENNLSYGTKISYEHVWNSGFFDFEVSHREKPSLKVELMEQKDELYFKHIEFEKFKVPSLNREELMAEKIRAAFQRLRSRDLYDLYRYSESSYQKKIVRKLAVIKCWNVHDPFDPEKLLLKIKNEKYKWDDLTRLVRPNKLINYKTLVNKVITHYSYLKEIDRDLKQIIDDSKKHTLDPKKFKLRLGSIS